MAYAYNQIFNALGEEDPSQKQNVFGLTGSADGQGAPGGDNLQRGQSGGEEVGSGQGSSGVSSGPLTSTADQGKAAKEIGAKNSFQAPTDFFSGAKGQIQASEQKAQDDANKFVSNTSSGGLDPNLVERVGKGDNEAIKTAAGWINPRAGKTDLVLDESLSDDIGKAKSKIENLGTVGGLGTEYTTRSAGGEASGKLGKIAARRALGTQEYQNELKASKKQAEDAASNLTNIEQNAESQAGQKLLDEQGRNRSALMAAVHARQQKILDELEQKKNNEQQAIREEGQNVFRTKAEEANAALRGENSVQGQYVQGLDPNKFGHLKDPSDLTGNQFASDYDVSFYNNLGGLLGLAGENVNPLVKAAYGGRGQYYNFDNDAYLNELRGNRDNAANVAAAQAQEVLTNQPYISGDSSGARNPLEAAYDQIMDLGQGGIGRVLFPGIEEIGQQVDAVRNIGKRFKR